MKITYEEIKARLTDLGFEEDDVTAEEYRRIFINSLNRAAEIIYSTVMLPIEDYLLRQEQELFTNTYEIDVTEPNRIKKITRITDETEDEDEIEVPYEIVPLYTLLAAHYAWLDDDLTKATIYWNEFDDLKNQLISNANRPRRATIIGGVGF
jgi:hypothetical protein